MMQPTQPDPSSEQPPTDAPASVEQASPAAEGTSGSWWQRLWHRDGSPERQPEEPEPTQTPSAITLTQEELDRRVQAETDRREAKRQADARAAERRRLRDEDPWAYAEQERNAEQAATADSSIAGLFSQVGAEHDRYTLDPLVTQLPEAERQRILALEGAGVGLDGRKLIVTEGLKALEKHWKQEGAAEAEQKLRRNAAFRKQVLSEFRRGVREPEFISGGPPSVEGEKVSDILRNQIRARH